MTTKAWRIRLTSDLERNEGQSATAGPDGGVMSAPAGTAGSDHYRLSNEREKFSQRNIEVDRFDRGRDGMAGSMPFGVRWPDTAALNDRRARERESFMEWIHTLDVPEDQRKVLTVLLGMVDDTELVDGRCAGVTYTAEVARRAGAMDDVDAVDGILHGLEAAGHLSLHPASEVFEDNRPGIVFRLRRPDVVLTVESAGQLWIADAWPRRSHAVQMTRALARERAGNG